MATQSIMQRAFMGGELAPALYARGDAGRYQTGLRRLRNAFVRRHGGVSNRSGTVFLGEVKDSDDATRLMPFIFKAGDQSFILEFGDLYVRFWYHGALVENPPATIYEVVTPYAAADVMQLKFAQSVDVITITHPSYAPRELRRIANDNWSIGTISYGASIAAPGGGSGSAGAAGTREYRYKITAAKEGTFEESAASAVITVASTAPPTIGDPIDLNWGDVSGAVEYYIHLDPYGNNDYGFIGRSSTSDFKDVGFAPDYNTSVPVTRSLFQASGDFPACVAYYQQRRMFARTGNNPESIWGSVIGSYANFNESTPLQDDDAVSFVIAGNYMNPVAHMIPLQKLIILTDAGEWRIHGDEAGVLKPSAITALQDGWQGSEAAIEPVVIGDAVLFVQTGGSILRELRFTTQQEGLGGRDLTMFASHLLRGLGFVQLAYAKNAHSIVWAVRTDGKLLGLTFIPELDILAWHLHDTGASGEFESVAVLPGDNEDEVYFVVKRTINGSTVRYVEKLAPREHPDAVDYTEWHYVDSGLAQTFPDPVSVVTGLDHLVGELVAVVADGKVVFNGDPATAIDSAEDYRVDAEGIIKLQLPATHVVVGLPYTPLMETLDIDVEGTNIRDRKKRVQSLTVIVEDTYRGTEVGPDDEEPEGEDAVPHMLPEIPPDHEDPNDLLTGSFEVNHQSRFTDHGRVVLRASKPLPWTVLGILPHLEVGG